MTAKQISQEAAERMFGGPLNHGTSEKPAYCVPASSSGGDMIYGLGIGALCKEDADYIVAILKEITASHIYAAIMADREQRI